MSYPKDVKRFKQWARAMEEGATVDKPNYGKKLGRATKFRKRRRRRRKSIKKNQE